MYNKIQPQQIQLHTFSSPTGNISLSQGSNYVYVDLKESLTGNFNVVGSLSVNSSPIFSIDASNTLTTGKNYIVNGYNNVVNGTGNLAVNSSGASLGGISNCDINGVSSTFSTQSSFSSILCGRSASIGAGVSGAVVLKDKTTSSLTASISDSLSVSFTGGSFFKTKTYFEDDAIFQSSDLLLDQFSSGLFSGNINVLGTIYQNSIAMPTAAFVNAVSGFATGVSGLLVTTGNALAAQINLLSGSLNSLSGSLNATGQLAVLKSDINQTISGEKTFSNILITETGFAFSSGDIMAPTASGAAGLRGQFAWSGQYFYLNNGSRWIRFSGVSGWS